MLFQFGDKSFPGEKLECNQVLLFKENHGLGLFRVLEESRIFKGEGTGLMTLGENMKQDSDIPVLKTESDEKK